MVSAMMVAEQAGVRMMKEYIEIKASKATPQYEFRMGLTLFGDKGYQAAKNELKVNLLGRGCIDMLMEGSYLGHQETSIRISNVPQTKA